MQNRSIIQIKKMLDRIDYRKIDPKLIRIPFLIRNDNHFYGINETYVLNNISKDALWVEINQKSYVIYCSNLEQLNYQEAVEKLVENMILYNLEQTKKEEADYHLEYCLCEKNASFYSDKYKECILATEIIRTNKGSLFTYKKNKKELMEKYAAARITCRTERECGRFEFLRLKSLMQINKEQYIQELEKHLKIVEDPMNLFDYYDYIISYSVITQMVEEKIWKTKEETKMSNLLDQELNLMINFNRLLTDYETKVKQMMIYRMGHAKKAKVEGTLLRIPERGIRASGDLFYIPSKIMYLQEEKIKQKKGDFIVRLDDNLSIVEAYECLSLNKIMA